MNTPRSIIEAFLKGRFSALLISIALLFLVGPLMPGNQTFADKLFGILILAVVVSSLRAIARTRGFFWFMLIFTFVNVGFGSFEILSNMESESFQIIVLAVRMLYFVVVFLSIMRFVLDGSSVTGDKICGAISAYLLMGVTWSFVYALFYKVDPGGFRIPELLISPETVNITWTMMYFSFTTLTTLGYGDIAPQTPGVQSYAIMEAASGQIFLAVIIARLIALQLMHKRDEA